MGHPIRYQELLNLASLGLPAQSFSFLNCTMQSDKYICVKDTTGPQNTAVIVDIANPQNPIKFPVTADSILVHPAQRILSLRAGQTLQVYNVDEKIKLKEHVMSEAIVFWKWISNNTLAIVTEATVYHWSLEGNYPPTKIFDRTPNLAGHQIINYSSDITQKWLLLVGITLSNNRVVGSMQMYSVEKNISQPIEGHCGAFTRVTLPGASTPSTLFSFANKSEAGAKLFVLEVGTEVKFQKKIVDFFFPKETPNDFPVAMQTSEKFNMIFMVSKYGYLYMFDLQTGATIYANRITTQTIFTTCRHTATNGLVGINNAGQVLSISVDENNIVPYICKTLNNIPLAIAIASKNNFPGADELFVRQFNALFSSGDYQGAARVACESPKEVLRTTQTIQRFKAAPANPGQPTPLLQYFSILLERGKLNSIESLELARPVLQQGRKELMERWLQEDKLGCSEELGDLVRQVDLKLALQVYYKAEVKHKVIACFAETGQFDKIVAYAKKVNYTPDWFHLLQNIMNISRPGALQLATLLVTDPDGALADVNQVVDMFVQHKMVEECNSLLLDVLKEDKPEEAHLQTKLLEINLSNGYAKVADAILQNDMYHQYDKIKIAKLLERAGLYQRALQHYSDLKDIKRVLQFSHSISPDFVVEYFGTLSLEESLDCLEALLKSNKSQNTPVVVAIATKYAQQLGTSSLIALFESYKCYDGLFSFLQQIVGFSEEPNVHFKYIEAAVKVNQLAEVERMVQESQFYDPETVRDFLMEAKLSDQVPLIVVCDRHGFVDMLTHYLYKNNLLRYIEVYLQKVNATQTPAVVGALLDDDCNEDYIKSLLQSVGNACPVAELVEQVEKRNRTKIILNWLEDRINKDGNNEPATHNAMAYICVDLNREPEKFLTTNPHYDSIAVGKYCESRDPHLAVVAYRRGLCDKELVDVTNRNGLFRAQARYLVERQDEDLWEFVLTSEENQEYRRKVIDQIVQTALPESRNPDAISAAVKAFMTAELPNELIELLEKIVFECSDFTGNRHLQNLLILTAIKADKEKVMDYVNRLDSYDAPDIANIAIESGLYEEAFVIFRKAQYHAQAVDVLIDHIDNVERAAEFADKINSPEVFTRLGKAQLDRGQVKEAMVSFIKASDHQYYHEVIDAAEEQDLYQDLVRYLQMCRTKGKDPTVETELIWSLAKTDNLRDMDDFVNGPNCANIQNVGDRCYNEGLYKAAKLLFNSIPNFARLATTLVKLEEYSAGVDAAAKAGNTRTWKEVCIACVDAKQFRLAQTCGLHLIVRPDELEEIIQYYENRGHFEEIIAVLEAGLISDRSHPPMFTELAILYSKYKPEKLMEHLRIFHSRLNMLKVLRVCERNHQWPELTFLYVNRNEFDLASMVMIEHSVDAWDHGMFKEIVPKVGSIEICYKAIQFYLEEHPTMANDLLSALVSRVDHTRVINLVRKLGHLPLIKPYLLSVQKENLTAVNSAINELYVEEEDYENLRNSIDSYDNIETLELASLLEKHDLLEFRRIAAYLYKQNQKWQKSIDLSKKDEKWRDVIDTAAASRNPELVSNVMKYFVEEGRKDCFAACLFTCYDLVAPDVVMELAWKHGMMDFAMPFFVQSMKNMNSRISELESRVLPQAQSVSVAPVDDQGFNNGSGFVGATGSMDNTGFNSFGNQGMMQQPGGSMNQGMMQQPGGSMMHPGMMPPGMMDQGAGFGSF
mmetsp:Transcript_85130/g.127573  ORF Transcript_85130/g.127573 Transcript_85130/m.127573 type:complete len:1700 (+) Transcript_85130:39-5138(+)